MHNLFKILNKIYISKYNLYFVDSIIKIDDDVDKVIKTHGGFAIFTNNDVYKITHSKNTLTLYKNQNNFYHNVNVKYLIPTTLVYQSSNVIITKERRVNGIKVSKYNLENLIQTYSLIFKKTNKQYSTLNKEKFLLNNFKGLDQHKYINKIMELLSFINKGVNLGLIHGDFWDENILQSSSGMFIIDYDRSNEYSFQEFDLINLFVFRLVYTDENPSWKVYIKIMNKILNKDKVYYDLKCFVDRFYLVSNFSNLNKVFFDTIIDLYIVKTLYNNNHFLEGLTRWRWLRHRADIEKLLWH
jgi:tRNA A-37 threonylcarbamoyl transferase component Bud32